MALTMDGSKRWPDEKRLVKFGTRCDLTPNEARTILAELTDCVSQAAGELLSLARNEGDQKILKRMKEQWITGVNSVSPN
jgi:serine/threonine-protein kinase HipA